MASNEKKAFFGVFLALALVCTFLLPVSSAHAAGNISDPVIESVQAPAAQVQTKLADNCTILITPPNMSCGDPIALEYGVGLQQRLESVRIDGEPFDIYSDLIETDSVELLRVDNSRVQGIRNTVFQANPNAEQALASIPERLKLVGADMTGRTMQDVIGSSYLTEGTDNTFANDSEPTMNNIERLSLVNSTSMSTEDPSNLGVLVIERGGNDYFNIAAITEVDNDGNPTNWGPITVVGVDDWSPILPNVSSTVLEQLPSESTYAALTWTAPQTVSGVYLSYEDLGIEPNQNTFGISLTAGDETSMNPAEWILDTPDTGPGGLDLIGTLFVSTIEPGFAIDKTSDPETGQSVQPGDQITYTVSAQNTGNTVLDPVVIEDDLGDVLNHATLVGSVATSINGEPVTSGEATIAGTTLAWEGALAPAETVDITYTVAVGQSAVGEVITNTVEGSAFPPDLPEITQPKVSTQHPVAGFDLNKTSIPATNTAVQPGSTVSYTLIGSNTGATPLDPVVIEDDLSDVFNHAAYSGDVETLINGSPVQSGEAVITGSTLRWQGVLQPGDVVTITYSVKVNTDAPGELIQNTVSGEGQPPNGPIIEPPPVGTTHTVPVPGFELFKEADPTTGSTVLPDQVIQYTVTGVNTGETVLDPVEITDDLSGIWNDVTYLNNVVAKIDGLPANPAVINAEEKTASWAGVLQPGETVTITYSVKVAADFESAELHNTVTGSAQPPGSVEPITPVESKTEHLIPGFVVEKSSDPVDQRPVSVEDTITYTVTGTNTGATVLNPVEIEDDLSGLFDDSGNALVAYQNDAQAVLSTPAGDAPAPEVDFANAKKLTWSGVLEPGQSVTITYSVTVLSEAVGHELENLVSATAQPPGENTPILKSPDRKTEHPVPNPLFVLDKTAFPNDKQEVHPGEVITYTLTGVNDGNTVLNPVEIEDDLSGLFDDSGSALVAYQNDAEAVLITPAGDAPAPEVDFANAKKLTWSGVLEPGQSVTITYSVIVQNGAVGNTLVNKVTASALPPTQVRPITPPQVDLSHPVPKPGFELVKTVNPESDSAVLPGDLLRYQIAGTNTGDTSLDPVVITDDLQVLNEYTTMVGTPYATIDGENPAGELDPAPELGKLIWTGTLEPGETVVIFYTVRVDVNATGEILTNTVTGSAKPPAGPAIPTVPSNPYAPPLELSPPPTVNPVAGFALEKSSDPATGSEVHPGQVISYTITGTNTGATTLEEVIISDDLSGLVDYATFNYDATVMIDGEETVAGLDMQYADGELTWVGELLPREVVTITYSVTVTLDAVGVLLGNVAEAEAYPEGGLPPIVPERSETIHPVPVPGFEVSKSSNPVTGSQVQTGDQITYTVTATNTGATVLDPVVVTDDLSGVLSHATYNDDGSATINGSISAGEPIFNSRTNELVWEGALEPGEVVTITYSVGVNADAGGTTLRNTVVGQAQPPGEHPLIETPRVGVEHPVATQLATTGVAAVGVWLAAGAVLFIAAGLTIVSMRRRQSSMME